MFFKNNNNIKLFTKHSYHLIDPSPWPLLISSGVFMLTVGLVTWMHSFKGGWTLLTIGLFLMIYIMSVWWRDVIREATFEEQHKVIVRRGLRFCMILFIVSEIMFFFAFFWAFFHSSLSPVFNIGGVWPPKSILPVTLSGIPLSNTFLLVSSGATVTWAWGHYAIVTKAKKHTILKLLITIGLALLFNALQGLEYTDAPFNISDSTFGSCFYMTTTGFHGFHVLVGTIVCLIILLKLYQANNRLFLFFVSGGFFLIFFVSFFGTIVWAVFSSLAIKPIISASQVLPAAMQHEVVGPTITIATTSSSMSINDCTAISSVASDTYDFYFCKLKKETVHTVVKGVIRGIGVAGLIYLGYLKGGTVVKIFSATAAATSVVGTGAGGVSNVVVDAATQTVNNVVADVATQTVNNAVVDVATQTLLSPELAIAAAAVFVADKTASKLFYFLYNSSGKLTTIKAVTMVEIPVKTETANVLFDMDSKAGNVTSLIVKSGYGIDIPDLVARLTIEIKKRTIVAPILFYHYNFLERTKAGSSIFVDGLPPFFFSGV